MEHFNWLRLRSEMIRWFINHRTKFRNVFFFVRNVRPALSLGSVRPRNIFECTTCYSSATRTSKSIPQSITHIVTFLRRNNFDRNLHELKTVARYMTTGSMCVRVWSQYDMWPWPYGGWNRDTRWRKKGKPKKCAWDVRNPTITYLLLAVSTFSSHNNNR